MTGKMKILDRTGDTLLAEWDVLDQASVDKARETFVKSKPGRVAYRVDGPNDGTQLHDFDPTAPEIIMTTAMQGG